MLTVIDPGADFRYWGEVPSVQYNLTEPRLPHPRRPSIPTFFFFYCSLKDNLDLLTKISSQWQNPIIGIKWEERDLIPEIPFPWMFINICNNPDSLLLYKDYSPSYYTVGGSLAFSLADIATSIGKEKIRLLANVAQSPIEDLPPTKKFFVRPEDLTYYSKYASFILLWGDRLSPLYEIYKRGSWLGDLNAIITDFNLDYPINNQTLIPDFGEMRINCHKKCYLNKCNICDTALKVATDLTKNRIVFQKGEEKDASKERNSINPGETV